MLLRAMCGISQQRTRGLRHSGMVGIRRFDTPGVSFSSVEMSINNGRHLPMLR